MSKHVSTDCVRWVVGAYHHLLPFGETVHGPFLAGRIRATYDCGDTGAGPVNESAARVAERMPGRLLRVRPDTVTYQFP